MNDDEAQEIRRLQRIVGPLLSDPEFDGDLGDEFWDEYQRLANG